MIIVKVLSISDTDDINILYDKIKEEIYLLSEEGIEIDFKIDNQVDAIECSIIENKAYNENAEEILNIFYYYIANMVADYIINYKENRLIKKIIQKEYYYFKQQDRHKIWQLTQKQLNEKEGFDLTSNLYRISKKMMMIEEIVNYLESHNILNIDGYIRFRLKYYIDDLKDAVEASIEEFLMEKEYNEFIRLLQYFVDIQEPKIQTLHILIDENHHYSLLDSQFKHIKNEYLEELTTEFLEGEIRYEDLLISSLITIAPTKIYIHSMVKDNNEEIMDTIQKVFGDRVVLCGGCDICKEKIILKKD